MTDDLLPLYNRELAYLRNLGAEFARAHPKIAGRLRLGEDTVEDPHVSRLIESVAFLNARVRRKIDDGLPELTDALLDVLYPHYLAPIPSMAIVQFAAKAELTSATELPAGTELESDRVHGEPCRFRTSYPVSLWPVQIARAALLGSPFDAPKTARSSSCAAVLQISLECLAADTTFADLLPDKLRFFLRGQPQELNGLYELLLLGAVEVAVASSPTDPDPAVLDPSCLRPVGFEASEGLLPYPDRSFTGYRLLTEFFAFPSKFHFIDVLGLPVEKLRKLGGKLELFVYLRETSADLEQATSADNFALGCTPIVNLFKRRAEPIRLSHTSFEYRVVADARRPLAMEIYSVDRVRAVSPQGEAVDYLPFYGLEHGGSERARRTWWYATRRQSPEADEGEVDEGREVYLRLVDLDFQPSEGTGWSLDVEVTCLNRDLPGRLPFGVGQPRLRLSAGAGAVQEIRCLTAPQPTRRPPLGSPVYWRLISHLSLNHLSIVGGKDSVAAFQEMLRLYEFVASEENRRIVESILDVRSQAAVFRVLSAGMPGFSRGTEVTIEFDEARFAGTSLFMFASVLERFLGLYASANSFVQVVLRTNAREGEVYRWPPRAGDKPLL